MSLTCSVEISDRLLPSLNVTSRKPERSHLTLGNLPGKKDKYYIILKTVKNPVGTRYKIFDNVQNVFMRFINEGKATIRFVQPPHDLKIQAKSEPLKCFVKLLRCAIEGKTVPTPSVFSGPSKIPPKQKTKLVITSRRELPRATGYPKGLETLQINNAELDKIDGGILRLQNLVVLNVSENKLKYLPPHLDLLQNLKELNVSKNNLGTSNDWRWIFSKNIQGKLVYLELSCNEITSLPSVFSKFKSLRYLYINDNKLSLLPNGLGHLSSLRVLEARNNVIDYLPSSFRFLRLESVDMSGNSSRLLSNYENVINHFSTNPQPSLVDMAAAIVVSNRQPYDSETLPHTLVDYLLEANFCMCGTPVFPPVVIGAVPFDLTNVASSVLVMSHSRTNAMNLIGITFCSSKCRSFAYFNNLLIVNVPNLL